MYTFVAHYVNKSIDIKADSGKDAYSIAKAYQTTDTGRLIAVEEDYYGELWQLQGNIQRISGNRLITTPLKI